MATKKTNTKSNNTKTKKNTNTKKKNQEPRKNHSTLVFLLIILVLLAVIAYSYRDKLEVFYNSTVSYLNSKDEPNKKTKDDNDLKSSIDKLENKKQSTTTTTVKKKQKFDKVTTTTTTIRKVATTTTTTTIKHSSTTTTTVKKMTTTTTVKPVVNQESKSKPTKVYLTKVTDDKLYPCTVIRNVDYKDAPLTETINALLQGPTSSEEDKDIVTNIPEGTKLLSAWVKGSVAYLNFSSEFENNHFGKEATIYQLYQIVYTATEFGSIKSVQILINGQKQDYLGGEGILIGTPLTRNSFQ